LSDQTPAAVPLCPSAQPQQAGARVFGVVGGRADAPRVGYLTATQPVTPELLALAGPVEPTEVFRIAAPCAGSACSHFSDGNCQLATKIVQLVPEIVGLERLPACRIRRHCRWWAQEGGAACRRCPLVVTETFVASPELRRAADPDEHPTQEHSRD
jgi:hypothetical protein